MFEPFDSASSTKLFPSKFSPFIAINNEFFFNNLVSVEIDFICALNFIFLLRNFAKSDVLVINFINYLMITKMINLSDVKKILDELSKAICNIFARLDLSLSPPKPKTKIKLSKYFLIERNSTSNE